jgi:[ribosomal protein S18]-alanine N-acetyltransferase
MRIEWRSHPWWWAGDVPILGRMEVREATGEDCEALGKAMAVVVEEGRWLATEPGADLGGLVEMFRTSVGAEDHFVFLAEEGGELAGGLGMHPTPSPGVLSIGMWVLPQWRRRGAGRLLVEAALVARPADAHKVELEVFSDNEPAIAFYLATGFVREGERRDHVRRRDGSLRSCLIMARLYPDAY